MVPVDLKWSAASTLDARTYTTRTIYYSGTTTSGSTSTKSLKAFNYDNLNADGYSSYFLNICSKSPTPAQCASLDTAGLTAANNATNVINFLRGDRSYEVSVSSPKQPFRTRASVLGDIVNASPVFVGAPPFDYADSGYSTHKTDNASRTRMVYAAANDGLLHAFKIGRAHV